MDYKEIKKKNGQVVVFCDFEDLLKEAFGLSTMSEVEQVKTNNGEYICHCPFCKSDGHTKHKLYVKDDLSVGHCFVCTRSFVNVTDKISTDYKIPDMFSNFFNNNSGLRLTPLTDPVWTLDKFHNEFDEYDQVGYEYLMGRHGFMDPLYKILGFKFMDGNIVMPFKYRGDVFYYQIRFSGSNKIKYYFPPISEKPPYIIEHGDNKKFVICEGVFDAISLLIQAPEFTPFAVLGSSISDYQLDFLREYVPSEIVIYMDNTELSKGVANKITSKIDYCPIRIIKSDGRDPEENMIRKLKYGQDLGWIKSKISE